MLSKVLSHLSIKMRLLIVPRLHSLLWEYLQNLISECDCVRCHTLNVAMSTSGRCLCIAPDFPAVSLSGMNLSWMHGTKPIAIRRYSLHALPTVYSIHAESMLGMIAIQSSHTHVQNAPWDCQSDWNAHVYRVRAFARQGVNASSYVWYAIAQGTCVFRVKSFVIDFAHHIMLIHEFSSALTHASQQETLTICFTNRNHCLLRH